VSSTPIDGKIIQERVFPDAGMPGWCWDVMVRRPDGEVQRWTPMKSYATIDTARNVLARWRKSRRTRGMVQMDRRRVKEG
jgi:hypothetical protein